MGKKKSALRPRNYHNFFSQKDGYNVYENIAESKDVIDLCCWAHACVCAVISALRYAGMSAGSSNVLYPTIKTELQWRPTLYNLCMRLREEIKNGKMLPKNAIGKAMAYTLNRWEQLSDYLKDGMLEIDNNLIEKAIRPIAIGHKNYLFAGSHEGAKRAAIVYSFFAMCKINDVTPAHWLKYVNDNLQDAKVGNLERFYPKNF